MAARHRSKFMVLPLIHLRCNALSIFSGNFALHKPNDHPFRLFIVAGEPSGDALACEFIAELRRQIAPRELVIAGVGDQALQGKSLLPMSDIAVMGFAAVIGRLPLILRHIRETARAAIAFKPDLILTIDSPDFSLRVLKKVRHAQPRIRQVHWVCPSVWAWRPTRAIKMRPFVDQILALLPFEPDAIARLKGPPTVFVGHPLIEQQTAYKPNAQEQSQRDHIEAPTILILPGSRGSEIRHLLPLFGEVVARLAKAYPQARFILPAVPHLAERISEGVTTWTHPIDIITGEEAKRAAFRQARAALAASGTVTLELALAGIPTVAAYKVSAWEAAIARRLIQVPTVLLPNLILGEKLMPEFLQENATASRLCDAMLSILAQTVERQTQTEGFERLTHIMQKSGFSPSKEAVRVVLQGLD